MLIRIIYSGEVFLSITTVSRGQYYKDGGIVVALGCWRRLHRGDEALESQKIMRIEAGRHTGQMTKGSS